MHVYKEQPTLVKITSTEWTLSTTIKKVDEISKLWARTVHNYMNMKSLKEIYTSLTRDRERFHKKLLSHRPICKYLS